MCCGRGRSEYNLPARLVFFCIHHELACVVEEEGEAGGEGGVEIVAGPWHPVVAVKNVGVSVMPRPP